LFDNFPIQNGLKQGDVLSPLLFNFAVDCAIKKVQKKQVALKLNGTLELLVSAADMNLGLEMYKKLWSSFTVCHFSCM
jgi:hypothetical protein